MNLVDGDPWSSRSLKPPISRGQGNRFPLPTSPKVEIHVFKGEGDVLNWQYQMENLFFLHDTPTEERDEFCVFYLKDKALMCWR